ncbi:hypothetical protein [Chroococcidiopsis sp.]
MRNFLKQENARLLQQIEILQNCNDAKNLEIERLRQRIRELEQHLNPSAV